MLHVEGAGSDCTGALDPDIALALARATRDTFEAEKAAVDSQITEYDLRLRVLRDSAEFANARLEDADLQVGRVLSIITRLGLAPGQRIDLQKITFKPPTRPKISYQPSINPDEESDSEISAIPFPFESISSSSSCESD